MNKKESYRRCLPHYNTSGQIYFVTWILASSIPKNLLKRNALELEQSKNKLNKALTQGQATGIIKSIKSKHYRLIRIHNSLLEKYLHRENNPEVNLLKSENLETIVEALKFWEQVKIESIAWCIMCNHVHWVFHVFEKDVNENLIYLQDIMHSVKLYSAKKINRLEARSGQLWLKESYDTTIRDATHFYNVVRYTLLNPVKAGLVDHWDSWRGNFLNKKYSDLFLEE